MRLRPILLSSAVVAVLALAGCATPGADSASPSPTASGEASTPDCLLDAPSGDVSDAAVVSGEGEAVSVTLPEGSGLDELADIQRTVVSEGEGDEVHVNDFVSVNYRIVDATSNEVVDSSERGYDGVLPMVLDGSTMSMFVAALECEPAGSGVVMVVPSSAMGVGASPLVVYAEAEPLPTVATGETVDPPKDLPAVTLDEDGVPTIATPEGNPPEKTTVAVLTQGDGEEVAPGDTVFVQYRGIKWSDGEEFDSSWSRGGIPTSFPTTGVVSGFRQALEGQKVGSQVIVSMPPADGYGESEGHELQNETIVFVVDILATSPTA